VVFYQQGKLSDSREYEINEELPLIRCKRKWDFREKLGQEFIGDREMRETR